MTESHYIPAAGAVAVEVGGPSLSLRLPGTLVVDRHPRHELATSIELAATGAPWLRIVGVRVECDGTVDEVTTDDLRSVRVIELIRENLPRHVTGSSFKSGATNAGEVVRAAWPAPHAMWEVAHTYNFARALRLHPVKALVDRYGISRSTAHRWVTRCREAGMITGG